MGREWYSGWAPKSSRRRGATTPVACGSKANSASAPATTGCMSTLLHLFDFHHFQFCLHQPHPFLPEEPPNSGVAAPRNSLEASEEIAHVGAQINTNRRDTRLKVQAPRAKGVDDFSSESSCSPGPRTPNLVARLMGLDLLPEGFSTPSNTTPRSSSASHPHIHGHRLSLQVNKENTIKEDLELSRHSCSAITTKRSDWKFESDENKSPGYYARQILKQVKESVRSRRFGADITNTKAQTPEVRRDEHLLSLKPKKSQKDDKPVQQKRTTSDHHVKRTNKKDEVFVRKFRKAAPAANKVKEEESRAQSPKKVRRLSSDSSCTASTTTRATTSGRPEFQYIARVLKRAGIERDAPVSPGIDPSIFHDLEGLYNGSRREASLEEMSLPCNRKLLFELIDEILTDILKNELRPIYGNQLVKRVWTRIRGFPLADCQILQDIDALVEKDLPKVREEASVAMEEEGDAIVREIESRILECMMQECFIY